MEDRFKFRAWIKGWKEMHPVSQICWNEMGELPIEVYIQTSEFPGVDYEYFSQESVKENIILMQCTGLKDKAGKLIYEGDILSQEQLALNPHNGNPAIVKWHDGAFGFDILHLWECLDTSGKIPEEIIGNIYEDSHLLKN